jgi:hypothetical protein
MFGDGPLMFREFAMREPWPLATVQDAMLFEFLPGRMDAILCGAQAVNAYVEEMRLSQDVDLLSPRAENLAEEVSDFLARRFLMDMRVRPMRKGIGYRIVQVREPENRHLVDVRPVTSLPPSQLVQEVLVLRPPELICRKVIGMVHRTCAANRCMDQADLFRLLLTFPELKVEGGPVSERLRAADASEKEKAAWKELVAQEILPEDDDDKFDYLK